jgi:hypothetical protein
MNNNNRKFEMKNHMRKISNSGLEFFTARTADENIKTKFLKQNQSFNNELEYFTPKNEIEKSIQTLKMNSQIKKNESKSTKPRLQYPSSTDLLKSHLPKSFKNVKIDLSEKRSNSVQKIKNRSTTPTKKFFNSYYPSNEKRSNSVNPKYAQMQNTIYQKSNNPKLILQKASQTQSFSINTENFV